MEITEALDIIKKNKGKTQEQKKLREKILNNKDFCPISYYNSKTGNYENDYDVIFNLAYELANGGKSATTLAGFEDESTIKEKNNNMITEDNFVEAFKPYVGINEELDMQYRYACSKVRYKHLKPVQKKIKEFVKEANAFITDQRPRTTTSSTKTKSTKGTSRSTRTKSNPLPDWQKCLQKFIKIAGQRKASYLVYNFILWINKTFDSKLGLSTPYIDLIRKIRDNLVKIYENRNQNKFGLSIPEYENLVNEAKNAIKENGHGLAKEKNKIEINTLSGVKKSRGIFKEHFVNPFAKKKTKMRW